MGLTYKALKYRDIKMNMTKAKPQQIMSDIVSDAQNEISVQQTSQMTSDACSMLIDDEATTTTKSSNSQQQFTAEHIMQLCLFLAEKSRAKQLQQNQEMNARIYYENFLKEAATDFVDDEKEHSGNNSNIPQIRTRANSYKLSSPTIKNNSRTPPLQTSPGAMRRTKLKCEKIEKQTILTDKLSTSFGNNNSSYNNTNLNHNSLFGNYEKTQQKTQIHQQQHQQQQQDKRDILLKIRQQIFERKRLRQVLNAGQRQNSQYQEQQQQQHRLQQQPELQQLADVWRPW